MGLWQGSAQLLSTLSGVAPATVKELTSAAVMIDLPARAVIFNAGDKCTGLYVIASGKVKLSSGGPGSKPRVVALLGPGAWFGETALLLQQRHAVGAQTGTAGTARTCRLCNRNALVAQGSRIRADGVDGDSAPTPVVHARSD